MTKWLFFFLFIFVTFTSVAQITPGNPPAQVTADDPCDINPDLPPCNPHGDLPINGYLLYLLASGGVLAYRTLKHKIKK